ncbi:MAG: MFS transporter [Chloroflexi bacterium]|nr:MFS transporter [Chloroflexota bacterium]
MPVSASSLLFRSARRSLSALSHRAADFTAGPPALEAESHPQAPTGRRLLWFDGLVSNISDSFVSSYVNPLALALGATNAQIGLLSALANLGAALGLLPGARLDERFRSRKLLVVLTGGGARLLLIAMALAPLLLPPPTAIYAFIGLIALRAFIGQLGYPAWSALVADLVPPAMRGRYFSSRNIALAVAALVFTPLAGRMADLIGLPQGYQVSFVIAGLVGFVATAIFARIPEPLRAAAPSGAAGGSISLASLRAHPRFLAFTAVAFIWNLSLAIAGPFFSVLLVRHLGASPTQIGLLAAINAATNIIGQRVWGRLNDRRGAAWVMRCTGLLIPCLPLLWALMPNAWLLLPVEAFSGLLWSGYSLANFNLMLGLAPQAQRARFIAFYQFAVFGAAFVGPLLGGLMVDAFPIRTVFVVSAAGRWLAAVLFLFTVKSDLEKTDRERISG